MEYKVLTKEDRRWTGKFSPENLEHMLNSYAAERVIRNTPTQAFADLHLIVSKVLIPARRA